MVTKVGLWLLLTLLVACSSAHNSSGRAQPSLSDSEQAKALFPSEEPYQSVSHNLTIYFAVLPQVLFKDSPRTPYVRMICFPSLAREWAVTVRQPEEDVATVEYVISEQPIWLDPRPREIKVERATAQITRSIAISLHEVWAKVLQHPEWVKLRNSASDGAACRFEGLMADGRHLGLETWTSRSENPAGALLVIGEMLRDLAQANPQARSEVEVQVGRKVEHFVEWEKKKERSTNPIMFQLVAFAPDNVGLTLRKSPTLYFFISNATSDAIYFTFTDSRSIRPVAEIQLESPTRPRLQRIQLKDYGIVLELEVQYRWYISVNRDTDSPSRNIVAGGVIERVDQRDVNIYESSCTKNTVVELLRGGIWYDAFACLNALIEADPTNRDLLELRNRLLHGFSGERRMPDKDYYDRGMRRSPYDRMPLGP